MARVLTVDQPCRLELECPEGVHVPGPASLDLLKYLFTVRGKSVLDLGCGNGLFAIAAAKLGAAHVAAIEIDHDAIANAQENVSRNGVAERVTVIEGDADVLLPLVAPLRIVLANILSSVLLQLLPAIRDALTADGEAILSGILLDERDTMLVALARGGWRVVAEDVEGAWWTARIARS